MKAQSETDQKVEETLRSIDGLQQVEANDFLFTRLEAQMENYNEGFAAIKYLSRITIALVLFIGLNAVTYYFIYDDGDLSTPIVQKTTAEQAIATEFDLSTHHYNY